MTSLIFADGSNTSTVAGSATETTMRTAVIPGGSMQANGELIVDLFIAWNIVGTITVRLYLGSTLILTMPQAPGPPQGLGTVAAGRATITIANRNATNSQYIVWRGLANPAGFADEIGTVVKNTALMSASQSSVVDTTVDQTFKVTFQIANPAATDVANLRGMFIALDAIN